MIVIDSAHATEADLRALGEQLKFDTRADRNAFIGVFSATKAVAMRQAAIGDRLSKQDAKFYDDHLVGSYIRNINTGYNVFTLTPQGLSGRQIDVQY